MKKLFSISYISISFHYQQINHSIKIKLLLLFILISSFGFTQVSHKEIHFALRHLTLSNRKIILAQDLNDLYEYTEWLNFDLNPTGHLSLNHYSGDSLCLRFRHYMPILLIGLNSIDTSKITISEIPFTKYKSLDSLYIETIKYDKKGNLNPKTKKVKIETKKNSEKFIYTQQQLLINGKIYLSSLISLPRSSSIWYCSPGVESENQSYSGVEMIYVFNLKTNTN